MKATDFFKEPPKPPKPDDYMSAEEGAKFMNAWADRQNRSFAKGVTQ